MRELKPLKKVAKENGWGGEDYSRKWGKKEVLKENCALSEKEFKNKENKVDQKSIKLPCNHICEMQLHEKHRH